MEGTSLMERPQTTLTISLLAKNFHTRIREVLTPAELQHVDKANDAMCSPSTCATHDYVDANEEMLCSFYDIMDREMDFFNEDDLMLWNMAWILAICNGFTKDWDDRPRAG